MVVGNSLILTCPFCGKEKEIMSLLSCSSFFATIWSDNKRVDRNMPEISYVQKCPDCGKYYIIERQEAKFSDDRISYNKGLLTYPEIREAFLQLSEEGFLNKEEESNVRMMLHHAYNDYHYRKEEKEDICEKDKVLFHENGLWLIHNQIEDDVFKAEYYREIGEFEKARSVLNTITVKGGFWERLVNAIKERLEVHDSKVFIWIKPVDFVPKRKNK
jgi:hypothetical protein